MKRRSNGSLPAEPEIQEIVVAEPQPSRPRQMDAVIGIVLDAVESRHTRRAYARALNDFGEWMTEQARPLNRALVRRYIAELRESGMGTASINQRLSAIRTLVRELADNEALDPSLAQGIVSIKGIQQRGERLGKWLNREQAQQLLNAPDMRTTKGKRDRAILAVLLGCGLRREELVSLTMAHLQQREGRWIVADLIGKRNKRRSVPMPGWAKAAVDEWLALPENRALHHESLPLFRPVNKAGRIGREPISTQGIHKVVRAYAQELGLGNLAPHDLRRTFAKLAHKGGAPVDQIGLSLGHDSIETTQRYLGIAQDLQDAPCDRLGLRLEVSPEAGS